VLRVGGAQQEVDARPSDAIALALQMDAPILLSDGVLGVVQSVTPEQMEALRALRIATADFLFEGVRVASPSG
jgi:bifunctional DNase/RNase